MKKAFSFILSFVFLLSTMGFTVSTHICGGKRVKSKFSLAKAEVSCGMEVDSAPCSKQTTIKSNCCQNEYQKVQIDDDYAPETAQWASVFLTMLAYQPSMEILFYPQTTQNDFFSDYSPPPLIKNIPILINAFLI